MKYEIELGLHRGVSWPKIKLNNDAVITEELQVDDFFKKVKYSGPAIDTVELLYYDKTVNDTIVDSSDNIIRDQHVEILSFWIDDILVNTCTLKLLGTYCPSYRHDFIEYCNKHKIPVDYQPQHELKFWHNGVWSIGTKNNFWDRVFEMQESYLSRITNKTQNYVGYDNLQLTSLTNQLKKYLHNEI